MVAGSLPKARTEEESRITPRRNRLRVELQEGREDVVTMELDFELELMARCVLDVGREGVAKFGEMVVVIIPCTDSFISKVKNTLSLLAQFREGISMDNQLLKTISFVERGCTNSTQLRASMNGAMV